MYHLHIVFPRWILIRFKPSIMFSCVHIFNIKKKKINNSITILHDVNNWISPLVRAQASSTYFGNLFRNTKKKKKHITL